jgi:GAF domain-containing protein
MEWGWSGKDVLVATEHPLAGLDAVEAESWSTVNRLGRALHVREADLPRTLEAVVATAVSVLPPATDAGINLYVRGKFVPQVVTGEPPHRLDVVQEETGAGPCIDASRDQVVILVDDTSTDCRWPQWNTTAWGLGVCSVLCLPMWVDDLRLGSLSVYAPTPGGFGATHEHVAGLLALHAALALADAQRTAALRTVIRHRDTIGMAKGILMEREQVDADAAFGLLQERSQRLNRKLVAIAQELTETGHLP